MSTPKDKEVFLFNPLTGELDLAIKFNSDRIVTAKLNAAGNPRMTFDSVSGQQIPDGPDVVVDNAGNIVMKT